MQCPNDKLEMIRGMIDRGTWISGDPSFGPGFVTKLLKFGMWPNKRTVEFIRAWKCPKCGKIELYADLAK